ncbi:hypothetical protein NEOC65_000578 [Neochlamydia sp. AcF65]|nr:hypothetical protein [Neochlamydia sp. AcF65]
MIKQNTNLKKSSLKIFYSQRSSILNSFFANCKSEFLKIQPPLNLRCSNIQINP